MKITFTSFDSIIGKIFIASTCKGICKLAISSDINDLKEELKNVYKLEVERDDNLFKTAAKELKQYFKGIPTAFNCRLDPKGTSFQKDIWNELLKIPFGKTISYRDVAQRINKPMAARAVGNACGKNPIPIIIPCHRVISADGSLGGFSSGIEIKKRLLEIEGTKW